MLCSFRGAVPFTHDNRQPLTDSERTWRLRQTEAVEVEPRRSDTSELHWRDWSSGGVHHKWQVTKRQETGRPDAGMYTSCNSNEMESLCLIGFLVSYSDMKLCNCFGCFLPGLNTNVPLACLALCTFWGLFLSPASQPCVSQATYGKSCDCLETREVCQI